MAKRNRSAIPPPPTGLLLVQSLTDLIAHLRPLRDKEEFGYTFVETCVRLGLNPGGNAMTVGDWIPDNEHNQLVILGYLEDRRFNELIKLYRKDSAVTAADRSLLNVFRSAADYEEMTRIQTGKKGSVATVNAINVWLHRLEAQNPTEHARIVKPHGRGRRDILASAVCDHFGALAEDRITIALQQGR